MALTASRRIDNEMMLHPRAEVFWQIPITETYKMTNAQQMPSPPQLRGGGVELGEMGHLELAEP